MKMIKYEIEVEFIRDVLGSAPADDEIKRQYIEQKMKTGKTGVSAAIAKEKLDEEQVNALKDADLQKLFDTVSAPTLTVFYRDGKGIPCIADHQIRGWFKEAFAFLNQQNKYLMKKGKEGEADTAYKDDYSKRWINERLYFVDRFFSFSPKISTKNLEIYERSIRGMTPMGPRVSLKSSELLKSGRRLSIAMETTPDVKESIIKEVFERGKIRGFGQWNNAQWGTFKVIKFKKIK